MPSSPTRTAIRSACGPELAGGATDAVLRAIAEPRRRAILQLVAGEELGAGEIAARFTEVTRTAISQHLTILKEAGLVTERRLGTRRLYRARPEGLAELRDYLAGMWSEALTAFAAYAEDGAASQK